MSASSNEVTKPGFVAREHELEFLIKHLADAKHGHGGIVFIAGEAGVGKSRLLAEFSNCAERDGVTVNRFNYFAREPVPEPAISVTGRGEFEEPLPLGLLPADESIPADETMPIGLLAIEKDKKEDIYMADLLQRIHTKVMDAFMTQLLKKSETQPTLLVLEDAHWMDTISTRFLQYLARNIQNSPILVCATYRPEELEREDCPLRQLINQLESDGLCHTLSLSRLSLAGVEQMVRNMLPHVSEISKHFINWIYEETEGNPAFVEAVINSLVLDGLLDRCMVEGGERIRVPATIRDVISARMSGLDDRSREFLRYAALMGQQFRIDVVQSAMGLSDVELARIIEKLEKLKFIRIPRPGDKVQAVFESSQARLVVQEGLSTDRLWLIHKRLGAVLEDKYRDRPEEVCYALARHFTLGKDFDKAYRYSVMAGDKAARMMAVEDAVAFYRNAVAALRVMPEFPETKFNMLTTLRKLAVHSMVLGDTTRVLAYQRKIMSLAEQLQDETQVLNAYLDYANVLRTLGYYDEAKSTYEKVLRAAQKSEELKYIAEAHRGLGYIFWHRGRHEEAKIHLKLSLTAAEQIGASSLQAKIFIDLGNIHNYESELIKALKYYEQGLEISKKLDEIVEMARAYNNIGDVYMKLEDFGRALASFRKCMECAEKVGSHEYIGWASFNTAECLVKKGELKTAREFVARAHRVLEQLGDRVGLLGVYRIYGILSRHEQNWSEAEKWLNLALKGAIQLGIQYDYACTSYELGLLCRDMSRNEEAVKHFNVARNIFERLGSEREVEKVLGALRGCS